MSPRVLAGLLLAAGASAGIAGTPAEAPVRELTRGWEVSFDPAGAADFRPWALGQPLPERAGRSLAFFRTRLPEEAWRDPVLFLRGVDARADVFLDGIRVGSTRADVSGPPLSPWTIVPLPTGAAGHLLTLRCTSANPLDVGPWGRVAVGGYAGIILSIVHQDAPMALVGIVSLALAAVALVLFLRRREDRTYLAFSLWAASRGAIELALSESRQLVWDAPHVWQRALPLARAVNPVALLALGCLLFGASRGWWRAWRLLAGVALLVCLAVTVDVERLYRFIWMPLNGLLLFGTVAVVVMSARQAFGGNAEARGFLVAMAPLLVAGGHDTLVTVHVLSGFSLWAPLGEVLFISGVATIVLGRLAELHRLLERHAHHLEEANERLQTTEARLGEAVRARDEFLSIASHELRTPLTSLQLQIGLLKRRASAQPQQLPAEAVPALERLERQAGRLEQLTASLLDVTRAGQQRLDLQLEPFELGELVRECAQRFEEQARAANSPLDVREGAPISGQWDRMRIDQVLSNLISNAIKYGAGKPIELAVSGDAAGAVVEMRDRGIGIAPADQARIFDRFERAVPVRNYGGLGLGLWIAREIVQAHGGTLSVASAPGEGTTFRVQLPRTPPAASGPLAVTP